MKRAFLLVTLFIEIYSFSVHPLIERPAMVENPVYNDFHTAPVHFFHEFRKIFVALSKIDAGSDAPDIFRSVAVVMLPILHTVVRIFLYYSEMRVDMVVILGIVFVVRRRNEQRIEVNRLDSQVL